jgi:hypothetical protein
MATEMLRGDELVARARRCGMALGWRTPMFLPALQHCTIEAAPDAVCPTACINTKGRIMIGEGFAATLTDGELSAVIAHELCHLIYRHGERLEDRQPKRFNIACDMALNQILREAQEQLPSSALYPTHGQEAWSAEQIYDKLPEQDEDGGNGPAMAGCGPTNASDDSDGDGEGQSEGEGAHGDAPGMVVRSGWFGGAQRLPAAPQARSAPRARALRPLRGSGSGLALTRS